MKQMMQIAVAAAMVAACAVPAAAQRYTARQTGELIELVDTTSQMNVVVVPAMGNAWKIQVKGKDLVRTSPTLEAFKAQPGYNGMPLLSPFANRLDQMAFYANGKKYNFDTELGNVRGNPFRALASTIDRSRCGSSLSSRPTREAPG